MKKPAERFRIGAIGLVLAGHIASFALSIPGNVADGNPPLDYFDILLLAANVVIAAVLVRKRRDFLIGGGIMVLIAAHAFFGRKLAPDDLTSGALLMVGILVFYVGMKIHTHLSARYLYAFIASYLALFFILIVFSDNAEALFLLFLMGLAASARNLRYLAYFWAITLAFTVCQPFAWESLFIFAFALTALFTAKGRLPSRTAVAALAIGLVPLFFVLLPVLVLVVGEELHNIELVLREADIRGIVYRTFWTATASTAILALFCIPLAYALSRLRFRGRTLLLSAADIPIIIPHSVAGIILIGVFGRQQILGQFFNDTFGIPIDGTVAGIILAQVFVSMPFILKSSIAAFDAVPAELEFAARTLGASSWNAFRRVALPLAAKGIFLGSVLAWARAAGEFATVLILAPTPEIASIAAFNRFNEVGTEETKPLVVVFVLLSLAMFFLLQFVSRAFSSPLGRDR